MPSSLRLQLFISAAICAVFPASYMVLPFQVLMLMFLCPRRVFCLVVSFCLWISPHGVLRLPFGGPSLPEFEKSWVNLVCVFVAPVFLHGSVANPAQNPLDPESRWFSVWVYLPLVRVSSYLKALWTRLFPLSLSYLSITRATNGDMLTCWQNLFETVGINSKFC